MRLRDYPIALAGLLLLLLLDPWTLWRIADARYRKEFDKI